MSPATKEIKVGDWVRVDPRKVTGPSKKKLEAKQHFTGGRVTRIEGDKVFIKPAHHRKEEVHSMDAVVPHKSRNAVRNPTITEENTSEGVKLVLVDYSKRLVWGGPAIKLSKQFDKAKVYDSMTGARRAKGQIHRQGCYRHAIPNLTIETLEIAKKNWTPAPAPVPAVEVKPTIEVKPPAPAIEPPVPAVEPEPISYPKVRAALANYQAAKAMLTEAEHELNQAVVDEEYPFNIIC